MFSSFSGFPCRSQHTSGPRRCRDACSAAVSRCVDGTYRNRPPFGVSVWPFHTDRLTLPPLSDDRWVEIGRFCAVWLTAYGVLARHQVTERAVGPLVIGIVAPGVEKRLRVGDVHEGVQVEAPVTQAAIDTFDKRVLRGLAGPDEVKQDPAPIGPLVERIRRDFSAMIDRDRALAPLLTWREAWSRPAMTRAPRWS